MSPMPLIDIPSLLLVFSNHSQALFGSGKTGDAARLMSTNAPFFPKMMYAAPA